MAKGSDLIARRERVVCPGVGRISTMTAVSARGAIITDADGREFIDFASGIGVMNVGHCDEEVVRAIRAQAGELLHTCFHVATYEPYVALCEKLVELFPHGERTKAMLVNTGAEAVENSIKIARQATGRPAVICFTGAFHGRTMLASTLTSKVGYKTGCGPYMPEVYRMPYPTRRPGEDASDEQVAQRALDRLRAAFQDTIAPEQVAAIIIEPIQGEGGFHVAPAAYLRGLRDLCDRHGIVLIFDEVQSGFCRTGRWAGYEHSGVTPDLSPWAKAMGGGMPIACVIGNADVMDKVTPGTLGGTYGGNPVSCAAALAAISRMEQLDLNARATAIGVMIRERFSAMAEQTEAIVDIRGLGAMMAMEFCEDGDTARPAGALVRKIMDDCRENGLLIIAAGVGGNVIRTLTPLVIPDEVLSRGLDILESAVLRHAGSAGARAVVGG